MSVVRILVIVGIAGCMIAFPNPLNVALALIGIVIVVLWPKLGRQPADAPAPRVSPWAIIVGLVLLLLCAWWFVPVVGVHHHGISERSNCKNNLKQLGLGLILYRDNQGRGTQFPDHDGADFLIKVWDAGVIGEPDLYLCLSSGDDNAEGAGLRLGATAPDACSYAGRRNRNQALYPGLFTVRDTSETAVASDDLEGDLLFNHEDSLIVLFADGHVEEIETNDPRIVTSGFGRGGLLDPLAN